jgi:putative transposase|tara:strand:+ start:1269 stop:2882 length:1614 start_codon:yes stop_codon:yes gene_type:complete
VTEPLLYEIDDAVWAEACRRAAAIRRFLESSSGESTVAAIADLASELQVSQATTYRLLRRFRADGTVMSLVETKRGRPTGHRALDARREEIIEKAIRTYYLKPTRPPVSQLVRDIETDCASAGLKSPHRRTIERRLGDLDLRHRAQRRGETRTVKATTAVPGTLSTSRPLEIVQIDHTKADIFVVDEETREPIGRPWLTLAMDVFSRMVTGFYLTMDAPSRLSTSLCLLHSVYDKTAWLKAREIEEPWPVAGLPDRVHVDNGADFRSRAFKRGCENAGIAIDWRPPGTPRFGGHIERLIGTQMGRLHLLPGTTFSNAQDLAEYDSRKHAALTLRELERYIALDIVGSYHQSIHSSLSRPPLAVWWDHEGEIPLRLPEDRLQFWVSFLPEQERTLRPTGIHLFDLRYWSAALSADVGRTERRLLVKYDPRDMSRVFVRRPSGNFVEARYADLTLAPISLHEALTARRTLREKGRREVDSRAVVRTALEQRKLVDEAVNRTAAVRRGKAQPRRADDLRDTGTLRGVDSSKPVPFVEDTE